MERSEHIIFKSEIGDIPAALFFKDLFIVRNSNNGVDYAAYCRQKDTDAYIIFSPQARVHIDNWKSVFSKNPQHDFKCACSKEEKDGDVLARLVQARFDAYCIRATQTASVNEFDVVDIHCKVTSYSLGKIINRVVNHVEFFDRFGDKIPMSEFVFMTDELVKFTPYVNYSKSDKAYSGDIYAGEKDGLHAFLVLDRTFCL